MNIPPTIVTKVHDIYIAGTSLSVLSTSTSCIFLVFEILNHHILYFLELEKNGTGAVVFFQNPAVLDNFRRLWER